MPRFMIKSAMNTGYNLNIAEGWLAQTAKIILFEVVPGDWNSIWQITPDGVIACAADPTLVIAPGAAGGTNNQGYWLQLSQRIPGDESQQWIIEKVQGYGSVSVYTIQNKKSGQYIDPNCGPHNFQQGQQTLTWPNEQSPTLNEYWLVDDVDVRPTAFYVQTVASGGLNTANPFVLDLATLSNTPNDGIYNCVVNPWEQGQLSQAWNFNPDGTITNARTPLLALSATADRSDVQIQPLVAGQTNRLQHWAYSQSTSEIAVSIKDSDTEYLNVEGGTRQPSVGNQVITWVQGKSGTSNYEWIVFDYAPTVPGQPVMLNVSSNNQLYALAIASGQSGAGAAVVLQEVQQGQVNLNQLWCLYPNGVVTSFQDQSLALTFQPQGNQPVTLEAYTWQNALQQQQQWWVQNNNELLWLQGQTDSVLSNRTLAARGPNNWMQYLDASSGYYDQAPLTTGGSGVEWTITPYQPPAHPGQWFTIRSGQVLPGDDAPSLLTVGRGGKLTSSVPVGPVFGAEPMAGTNQLWRLTLDGALVSAINPTLVVTVSGNDLALSVNTSAPEQQWQWGYSGSKDVTARGEKIPVLWGVLQNMGSGNLVLMSSGASGTGNTVSAEAMLGTDESDSPGNYPTQLWYIAPHMPAFDQPSRLTLVQPGETGSLVLALQGDKFTPGAPVVAVESSSTPATMTWQFTDSGQIVNTVNSEAVLSLEGGNSNSQTLVVYPLQPGNQPFQSWALTAEGQIYNLANMQVLTISVANGAATLTTSPVVEDGAASGVFQHWDVSPSPALMTVLMQPPVPYPVAPAGSDEAAAYVYINAMLGLQPEVQGVQRDNALRAQYANLAAPLASYQRKLGTLKCPPGIGDADWTAVVDQLDAELTAAIGVQALFVQMSTFHLMFSQAQAMALPSLITAVQLAETDKVTIRRKHAWIWDLCEGLTNTILNGLSTLTGQKWAEELVGESVARWLGVQVGVKYGFPALGNLLNTALTTTQAVLQSHQVQVQRDINFEMTVLQLQQTLLQTFQAMGVTLGEIQTMVFNDWGKLRAVYEMTTLTQGGASLYWPSMLAPTLVDQLLPGYVNSVLQLLMPNSQACQTIYRYSEQNQQPLSTPGLQSNLISYVDINPDGTQTTYTVGQSTPTQQMTDLMNVVWSNGVNPFQFFHAQAGWSQMNIEEGSSDYTGKDNTFIVAYVQNFTAQSLSINLFMDDQNNPEGQIWGPTNPVPLTPYGVSTFAAATSGSVGQPIHGTMQLLDSSNNVLATGYFNCEGTSHDWACSIQGTDGYRVTSTYQGVVDDMISWNIGFYAD